MSCYRKLLRISLLQQFARFNFLLHFLKRVKPPELFYKSQTCVHTSTSKVRHVCAIFLIARRAFIKNFFNLTENGSCIFTWAGNLGNYFFRNIQSNRQSCHYFAFLYRGGRHLGSLARLEDCNAVWDISRDISCPVPYTCKQTTLSATCRQTLWRRWQTSSKVVPKHANSVYGHWIVTWSCFVVLIEKIASWLSLQSEETQS